MAYDLAKAIHDAGYLNINMSMNDEMLKKVTPEGTVPILDLGVILCFFDTFYCIGLDADTKTGEHLTIVHDKKNKAFRVRMGGGIIIEPLFFMVKENDIVSCVAELMDATIRARHGTTIY